MPGQLSGWKQKIVAFAGGLGAPGLFLISFLDSSFLTFPIINDLLLIELAIQHPARMPLYASMAALGSTVGSVLLFYVARKSGEALFHKRAGRHAQAIRHWTERNGFAGVLAAAMLPPPVPFKIFVLAAAVFDVPFLGFTIAIAVARSLRYFGMGYLAVRYGNDALPYVQHHKLLVIGFVIVFVVLSYGLSRIILAKRHPESSGEPGV